MIISKIYKFNFIDFSSSVICLEYLKTTTEVLFDNLKLPKGRKVYFTVI